jgi:hypothetical protein
MNVQNILIVIIFIGLMLIAAGVGALVAKETTFGTIFLIVGAVVLVIDVIILVLARKRRSQPD